MDIILVNEKDEPTGTSGKLEAHQQALLHRAFSVFIFNKQGEMLLQKRATEKYHSGGLWTNACCSHPRPGESLPEAAEKRLQEEMGFSVSLKKAFDFIYRVSFDNGLTEYEFDHVYIGYHNGKVYPDPAEVSDHYFNDMEDIGKAIKLHPHHFTEWFKIAFPKVEEYIASLSVN